MPVQREAGAQPRFQSLEVFGLGYCTEQNAQGLRYTQFCYIRGKDRGKE